MTRAGNAQRGVYMTDGIFNVALLNLGGTAVASMEDQNSPLGLIHFGLWVDSADEMDKKIYAAGGSYITDRKETNLTSITWSNIKPRKGRCSTSPRVAGKVP